MTPAALGAFGQAMESFGGSYSALVAGASGGIGAALVEALAADPRCRQVLAGARAGQGPHGAKIRPLVLDITDPESLAAAAAETEPDLRLVLCAAGYLHGAAGGPEKSWRQIEPQAMAHAFAINATGPALLARHLLGRLPRGERAIFAALSARVGSISDNRSGGWYGYRASKAALNQILKCLAIEAARSMRHLVVAGLQPGTVRTGLSAPFRSRVAPDDLLSPEASAAHLLGVLDRLVPAQSGRIFDWRGEEVPP
ncbi:MAG: SDR family NAD(P)-dependent oxidoreductase [Pseudomonadota bacterium]